MLKNSFGVMTIFSYGRFEQKSGNPKDPRLNFVQYPGTGAS